ncbi:uncharacterized protein LODBEIA_P34210 [Lodderomyces beijingensis]|uniref:Uncharacterized protein n=1 Tax=Lodderomyces beijingensis TaxID=1775926 RepID=A0ABP0ZSD9_9ASCO
MIFAKSSKFIVRKVVPDTIPFFKRSSPLNSTNSQKSDVQVSHWAVQRRSSSLKSSPSYKQRRRQSSTTSGEKSGGEAEVKRKRRQNKSHVRHESSGHHHHHKSQAKHDEIAHNKLDNNNNNNTSHGNDNRKLVDLQSLQKRLANTNKAEWLIIAIISFLILVVHEL